MTIRIALIGDYKPTVTAHQAIPKALEIASRTIGEPVDYDWIETGTLDGVDVADRLSSFDGIWCVPASPYNSLEGALAAIRFARENAVPFLGTCGGYQHAVLEYARNVLGLTQAANAEIDPEAEMPLIAPLTCALIDQDGGIYLKDASLIRSYYGTDNINETYRCSYGFNAAYAGLLDGQDLQIGAWDGDGDPRSVELQGHPFFIGTAFQPERSGLKDQRHPLITAFVQAASDGQDRAAEG